MAASIFIHLEPSRCTTKETSLDTGENEALWKRTKVLQPADNMKHVSEAFLDILVPAKL